MKVFIETNGVSGYIVVSDVTLIQTKRIQELLSSIQFEPAKLDPYLGVPVETAGEILEHIVRGGTKAQEGDQFPGTQKIRDLTYVRQMTGATLESATRFLETHISYDKDGNSATRPN